MQPNKENIRKWVDALRSGEYEQGRNRLERVVDGTTKHCCLGVACRVAMDNGIDLEVTKFYATTRFDDNAHYLPIRVRDWLGLDANSPCVRNGIGSNVQLARLNDSDNSSFANIADHIERTYLGE